LENFMKIPGVLKKLKISAIIEKLKTHGICKKLTTMIEKLKTHSICKKLPAMIEKLKTHGIYKKLTAIIEKLKTHSIYKKLKIPSIFAKIKIPSKFEKFVNKKVGCAFLIILLIFAYKFIKKNDDLDDDLPVVTATKAEMGQVVRYIDAIGTLRPFDAVIVRSELNSMIVKIHFEEGTIVEKGALLLELDKTNAEAALMEAEANYRRSKSEFEPIEKLTGKGVMAKLERDKKKADMEVAAAKVKSCKNHLEKHSITAPFKGLTGLKEISCGQIVAPGNELVKLVDSHPLRVDFKVAESEIENIYIGQDVKVFVGGDQLQEYQGKVTAISPESDKITHSFEVRALLDVPEEIAINSRTLRPGRFVSVKVVPDGAQTGILIPESCLEKYGDEYFCFRVVEGIAVRTLITVGMKKDGAVEIITGVNTGDTVITSGQQGVFDGRAVSVQDGENQPLSTLLENAKKLAKKNEK
jgi:membrane fusion protein (multidrug efflux system)